MKLLTKELREKLLANGREQAKVKGTKAEKDFPPVVKFFYPAGNQTWLLTELDPEDVDLPRFRGEAWRWVSVADWRSWRRPPCGCSSLVRPQRSPFLHPGPCAGSAVAHSPCQARAFCAPARACA